MFSELKPSNYLGISRKALARNATAIRECVQARANILFPCGRRRFV